MIAQIAKLRILYTHETIGVQHDKVNGLEKAINLGRFSAAEINRALQLGWLFEGQMQKYYIVLV